MPKMPTKIEHHRVEPTHSDHERAEIICRFLGIDPSKEFPCSQGCTHSALDFISAHFNAHWLDCLEQTVLAHGGTILGRY